MAKLYGIYKCNICGNVVSVINAGVGELVCCDEEMKLMEEKTAAVEGKEKHVPVVEIKGNNITVKVGTVPHPMEEKHYIQLIELMRDGKALVSKRLNSGEKPEAVFCLADTKGISAREYCNVHGLWKN